LNDGVDIAEARVIGTRHDASNGSARALALVDDDVQAFSRVVSFVACNEERGIAPLRFPAEREFDGGLLGRRSEHSCKQQASGSFSHGHVVVSFRR
jgi:hypothetical protein